MPKRPHELCGSHLLLALAVSWPEHTAWLKHHLALFSLAGDLDTCADLDPLPKHQFVTSKGDGAQVPRVLAPVEDLTVDIHYRGCGPDLSLQESS